MLELRRLRLLHELSRRGTIAAVGEALHLSPSGVSAQLNQLETEVGVPLLERVGRKLRLTEAGRALVTHTDAILSRLELASAELATLSAGPRGTVRIASFQTATHALVLPVLTQLKKYDHLAVQLSVLEPESALPALLSRDFDIVIGEQYPGLPSEVGDEIERSYLREDPLRFAVADVSRVTDISGARDQIWVMEPRGSAARAWATNLCRAAGFEPTVGYESDDMSAHVELVRQGHAVGFLPDLIWNGRCPSVRLINIPGQSRTLYTAMRRVSELHPANRLVRDALHERARQEPILSDQELTMR
jgi:DNA-binding transcriptional LysR family regulator